jgi:iron complex outermembrane receptor protein
VRYDHYDDVGSTTNPRFGLVYAPTEKLWFKSLYGTAFRAPGWSEMYAKNNPAYVGNGDVEPENVRTFEFLMGYNFTKNIRGSVTWYHMQAEDMVLGWEGTFRNVGKFESQGVEAEMKLVFGRFRYAYLNASYQNVADTTHTTIVSQEGQSYTHGDFFPGNVPEFSANLGVNWDFFSEHLIANLSLNYVGERKRTEEKVWAGEELADRDTRDSTDGYALVNTSLTFRNFFKGWEFQISGFNLLDEDVRDPVSATSIEYDLPRPGTTFTGRISYSF